MVESSGAEESELTPVTSGVRETTGCPQIIPQKKWLSPHLCLAIWFWHSIRAMVQNPSSWHHPHLPSSLESAAKPSLCTCHTESWAPAFNTDRPWPGGFFHFWGMIQPRRQDQTDPSQRKEGWVADAGEEEKQTGLEPGRSHSCWAAGGGEQEEAEECLLKEPHNTQRPLTDLSSLQPDLLIITCIQLCFWSPRKTLITFHICIAQYDFQSTLTRITLILSCLLK